MGDAEQYDPAEVVDEVAAKVEAGMDRIFGGLSGQSVYATEQVGDRLVITAAAIERAGGFGFGAGAGSDGEDPSAGGAGGGGGGGGTGQARPVAVIEVTPQGVSVRPVLDFTKIGVTVVVSLVAAWRMLRRA